MQTKCLNICRDSCCKMHCYASRHLDEHLKRVHKTAAVGRQAISSRFAGCERVESAQLSPRKRGGRVVILGNAISSFDKILTDWNDLDEKQTPSLAIADHEVAKNHHTLWCKRNEWPKHLASRNPRHLSLESRLLGKENRVPRQAVEIKQALIESSVEGLFTLD